MVNPNGNSKRWVQASLIALWVNVISALLGAWYILSGAQGMALDLLEDSPFSAYFWPGIILLVAVGGSSLVSAISRHLKWHYQFELTIAAGCILLGWLIAEFIWIPEGWAPQLLFALAAIVMIVGGYHGWRPKPN